MLFRSITNIYLNRGLQPLVKDNRFDRRDFLIKKLSQKLDLSETQKQNIEKIMDKSFDQVLQVREKNRPEVTKIFERRNTLIKKELNSEQKNKFNELVLELKTRRQHWEKKLRSQVEKNEHQQN